MAVQGEKVDAHGGDAVDTQAASDYAEDRCGKCLCEEVVGQSITEEVVLVGADIVRQGAYVDLLEVDFDDHVYQTHATLRRMVEFLDPLVRGPSRSSHGRERW